LHAKERRKIYIINKNTIKQKVILQIKINWYIITNNNTKERKREK